MPFHLDSDAVALLALIVSLVALFIALLQVIQQYAATAYDYRRCSARTMGGWARHTKRLFFLSEIRFEITFTVPHIHVDFLRVEYDDDAIYTIENAPEIFPLNQQIPKPPSFPVTAIQAITDMLQMMHTKCPKIHYLPLWGHPDESESSSTSHSGPLREAWFLSLKGAVPEAACSWLRLLHDTQSTNLCYKITTKRLSIDSLPRDVSRPLATADRRAFLATLTLLQTEWRDRGANGIFIGRSSRNGIEITATNNTVGTVYSYDRTSHVMLPTAAKILKKGFISFDLKCMFNYFRLKGFTGDILTWSRDELCQSLTDMLGSVEVATHFSQQYALNKLNIGIGELIASLCHTISMPRRDYFEVNECVFSSSSLGCTFGMPLLSAILCNKEEIMVQHGFHREESVLKFVEMLEGCYAFLRADTDCGQDWLDRLFKCLEWASNVPSRSNILFYEPDWPPPDLEECYNLMAEENQGLDRALQNWHDNKKLFQKVALAVLRAYARKDATFMQGPVGDNVESWIREAVLLTTTVAVEAFKELSQQEPAKQELWRNMIINRILRGVLWTIHNGNAPGRDPLTEFHHDREHRSLECSLSSKWLEGNVIVYIA